MAAANETRRQISLGQKHPPKDNAAQPQVQAHRYASEQPHSHSTQLRFSYHQPRPRFWLSPKPKPKSRHAKQHASRRGAQAPAVPSRRRFPQEPTPIAIQTSLTRLFPSQPLSTYSSAHPQDPAKPVHTLSLPRKFQPITTKSPR